MPTVRDYAAERDEINAVIAEDTVPKVFLRTATAHPDVVALRRMAGDAPDAWEETTYGALREQVAAVAGGLQAAGLETGPADRADDAQPARVPRRRPGRHVPAGDADLDLQLLVARGAAVPGPPLRVR